MTAFLTATRPRFMLSLSALLLFALTAGLSAHRVIGKNYPIHATALVQSPTASPVDLPIPLWNTGLSVACFRITNTSLADVRVTAIGLELPGRLSGFALVWPLDSGLTVHENVEHVPGFPGVALDFALVTGTSFTSGRPRLGLLPSSTPTPFCVSGPFNPAVPIETMLNGVFVRFEGGESQANATDVGVWERR